MDALLAAEKVPIPLPEPNATRPGSCSTCAKAKSRCVRRNDHDRCERCKRLDKDCYTRAPTVRKRRTILTHAAQLKHLESKIENLTRALTMTRGHGEPSEGTLSSTLGDHAQDQPSQISGQPSLQLDAQDMTTRSGFAPSAEQIPQSRNVLRKEASTAALQTDEVLLDRYKRLMAQNMPFVVIPCDESTSRLVTTEPFLMQAIRVVANFDDTAQQRIVEKTFVREACERLLTNGEKSLGLLQGLLIVSNWYNVHVYSLQNSTNLLHLAMALATNLNIDRGPGACEKDQMEAAMKTYGVSLSSRPLSNDERRAVLGTYYLTSLTFTCFRKVETLRWTPWLAECAKVLGEAKEYESDSHLLQLVHMQRVMQESMSVGPTNTPSQLFANSFLKELEALKPLAEQGTIATVLRLQDACTRIAIWQQSFAGLTRNSTNPSCLRHGLDGMWQCMEALKIYIDVYMSVPPADYLVVPFGVFAQFAYAFVVLIRAFSLEVAGWDTSALHGFLDLPKIAEDASQRYEAVAHASLDGLTLKTDAFANWGTKLRRAKAIHDSKLQAASQAPQAHLGFDEDVQTLVEAHLRSESTRHFPTTGPFTTDAFIPFMAVEDFWNGLSDPLQASLEFDFSLGNM